jgi:molecular chaperone IbpA
MTTFDFSPLFRTSVGFDRLATLLNSAHRVEQSGGYPPYNIQSTGDNTYQITMAVAGFSESELSITSEPNTLLVRGDKSADESGANYLYKGIGTRSFERRFNLADHVKVSAARLDNGLLHIELEREIPEAMKPKKIAITNGAELLEINKDAKAA